MARASKSALNCVTVRVLLPPHERRKRSPLTTWSDGMNRLICRVFAGERKASLSHVIFAVALFAGTSNTAAQVHSVTLNPPSPTTLTNVSIVVTADAPCSDPTLSRVGNTFSIFIPYNCSVVQPIVGSHAFQLGYLQPGEYSYEVREGDGLVVASGSFVVADAGAPFIPTLTPLWLTVAALALAAVGAMSVRLLS